MTRLIPLVLFVACATVQPPAPSPPPVPPPVVPVPAVTRAGEAGALHVDGSRFIRADGSEFRWRGVTDFRLLKRVCDGEDITPILDERIAVGANLVRVLGMAHNLFDLSPTFNPPQYADCLRSLADQLAARGLRMEFVLLADAQVVLANVTAQRAHVATVVAIFAGRWNVVLELCNECRKNGVDPTQFGRPSGVLISHGSGLTDEDPVAPRWDWAGYHARRDGPRGFTNLDPYEFQAVYPQPVPLIADESAKPENYGNDPEFAYLMGSHAALGSGGTFHTTSGLQSVVFTDAERACARRFFQGVSR